MKTTGSTVLITGATSGIGLGLAERLSARGDTVIVAGRRRALLDEIVATHPGVHAVELDVADPESIRSAFETVTREHPDLDVVITMAGIMLPEDLRDPAHLDVAESIVTTNLLGTIRTAAAFGPWLAAKPDGVLMTVSSGLAFVPLPVTPTYSATKAAVHSFTQSLRVQWADTPLQVVELVPPAVQTTLSTSSTRPCRSSSSSPTSRRCSCSASGSSATPRPRGATRTCSRSSRSTADPAPPALLSFSSFRNIRPDPRTGGIRGPESCTAQEVAPSAS
jgi:uncharacterized oxidoreductase